MHAAGSCASQRWIPRSARADPKAMAEVPELVDAVRARREAREELQQTHSEEARERWKETKRTATEVDAAARHGDASESSPRQNLTNALQSAGLRGHEDPQEDGGCRTERTPRSGNQWEPRPVGRGGPHQGRGVRSQLSARQPKRATPSP